LGASSTRVIATSASRDAANGQELIDAVKNTAGLSIEVISGQLEAAWAFRGVTSDPLLAPLALLILDLGGGSTEFIVGENSLQIFSHSYDLGTVRLLHELNLQDPPGLGTLKEVRARLKDFLDRQVAPDLEPALRKCTQPVQLIGTGGTATILARMEAKMETFDREKIEATRLQLEQLCSDTERLWQMPLAQRQKIVGLPPNRADVILTGMAIYESIMARFGFSELRISTRGLRFAALLEKRPQS
jgi:exopolyphosphatase/guanosine-5'-triphosphate,3'-diphosphate pyrophosphatase